MEGKLKDEEDLALIQLWILADKLIIPELQNLVIELAAIWSRNMSEQTKFGLIEKTSITDFEVEVPED